jgi:Fe-S cluster assembly protein SufD
VLPLDPSTIERASASAPAWLRARRLAAFEVFAGLELPSERDEVWRYVDLDLDLDAYRMPPPDGEAAPGEPPLGALPVTPSGRARVVDGSVVASSGEGVDVRPLGDALRSSPERLEEIYGAAVPVGHDIFTAAHHAFGHDAVVVQVPPGAAPPGPVHVAVRAAADDAITFPHVLVDVGDGAQASVVVEYDSPAELRALVAPQLEVVTGADANLALTITQSWGYATTALAQGHLRVGRDSNVTLAEAGLGGRLSRFHLTVTLEGRGASARVLGAYFGERDQTLDYRYFVRHVGLDTHSDMFLKGAVEDEALSVFTGLIRIEESAQRTDAFQTNRNLILSEGAAAQSVPNLEILANDVRCGHGSTVGPLDDEQRYYLMSRGLDGQRADRLQVRGFFEEVIQRFPEQAVAGPVRDAINAKYVAAQREGRV